MDENINVTPVAEEVKETAEQVENTEAAAPAKEVKKFLKERFAHFVRQR